jgi:hypothetical protein
MAKLNAAREMHIHELRVGLSLLSNPARRRCVPNVGAPSIKRALQIAPIRAVSRAIERVSVDIKIRRSIICDYLPTYTAGIVTDINSHTFFWAC